MSEQYTILSTMHKLDPSVPIRYREFGNLYDFMSYSAGVELCDILIPSILDPEERQIARELLNEDDADDSDLPVLAEILKTVEGGDKWCNKNIKVINDNSLSFNIWLDNVSVKYTDFIIELTSNPNVMKHIRGGKTWTYDSATKFIDWCVLEIKQNKNIRTNYYYLIKKYCIGDIDPIGIVGIRQVNKQDNKNKNPKYRNQKKSQPGESMINYNLDVFISPEFQNYGSGTCAIRKCLEQYWTIYPDRQVTINIPTDLNNMIKIATNLGAVMEKTFTTGRAKFLKYIITAKTIIYPEDYLYLPPKERREVITRRKHNRGARAHNSGS
jgi:RimJ/RimL family protein N-acetyltransferase